MLKILNQIIHLTADADTDNYQYDKVYAGAGGSITINGTSVTMVAGSTIEILVKTISSTANIYVLGIKKINNPPQIIGG